MLTLRYVVRGGKGEGGGGWDRLTKEGLMK